MFIIIKFIILSIVLTTAASFLMLKYVTFSGFLDQPNQRKIHTKVVPRFGGIAFSFCSIFLSLWYLNFDIAYTWFAFSALIIIVLGIMDDLYRISFKIKSLVQLFVGALVFMQFIHRIPSLVFFEFNFSLPAGIVFILFMVWFMGMVNSVNLIDGMDGLAGGTFFILCIGASFIGWMNHNIVFSVIYLIIMGSLFGFLVFNGRPAKFFMGDTGSLFLGFILSVMPLLFYVSDPNQVQILDLTPFMTLSSYFIIDTLRVVLIRIKNKQNPLKPDNNHMHHDLLKTMKSYNRTLFVIYGLGMCFVIFSLLQIQYKLGLPVLVLYAMLLVVSIFIPGAQTLFLNIALFMSNVVKRGFKKMKIDSSFMTLNIIVFTFLVYFGIYIMTIFIFNTERLIECFGLIGILFGLGLISRYFKEKIIQRILINVTFVYVSMIIIYSSGEMNLFSDHYLLYQLKILTLICLLVLFGLFYLRNVFLYLMRFWQVEDLLLVILFSFSVLVNILHIPTPMFFPDLLLSVELMLVYVILEIIFNVKHRSLLLKK